MGECCDGWKHLLYEERGKRRGDSRKMCRFLEEAIYSASKLEPENFHAQLILERLQDVRDMLAKESP